MRIEFFTMVMRGKIEMSFTIVGEEEMCVTRHTIWHMKAVDRKANFLVFSPGSLPL